MLSVRKNIYLILACAVCAYWLMACKKKTEKIEYTSREQQVIAWQKGVRTKLSRLLKIDDLISSKPFPQLDPIIRSSKQWKNFTFFELEINSTAERRIKVVFTIPTDSKGPFPAVVVIGGHGCTRHTCYTDKRGYHSFARILAENGYVTISTQVSQHNIHEKGRTLTGERLWGFNTLCRFFGIT